MVDTDFLIIGLGAAGTIAAHVLTSRGARVMAIDAGGWQPAQPGWFDSCRPTVRGSDAVAARSDRNGLSMANAVGGSKHISANQSFRLPAWNHQVATSCATSPATSCAISPTGVTGPTGAIGPTGPASPALGADQTVADWPLSAADLAPYHDMVERLRAVTPSPPAEWTDTMAAAARRLGWTPFAAPVATADPASRALLDPAIIRGALTVLTETTALGLTTDARGRVTGARVWQAGRERAISARRVVLAAHTYENVRLLLLSRSAEHPNGVGNSHGQLGLHYATHNFVSASGRFTGRQLGRASGLTGHAVAVADFDADAIDPTRHGFVGGSLLQAAMGSEPVPPALRGSGPADAVGMVWAQPEQLTRLGHRLDLDPTHVDPFGRPVLRITHSLAPDDERRAEYLRERLVNWLTEAGAEQVWPKPIAAQALSSHVYGGTRMGTDPKGSVVNGDGALHDDPRVIVLGASVFPSTGGRGPTQTIEALAWRAAEAAMASADDSAVRPGAETGYRR